MRRWKQMKGSNNIYKEAGVDVEAGYQGVELIKKLVAKTSVPGVLSNLGGFAGLFQPDLQDIKEPVLVSGTDGVGTKLKIAFALNQHDTIGIDCVAMCVNDIICNGATPLFFLDYIALGKNIPEKVAEIVSGIAQGCLEGGCALIGGETAEMPGLYQEEDYDLAGFAVGMVDKAKILDPKEVKAGDKIIGLASSGLHSNGFSLVRHILAKQALNTFVPELEATLGQALLTPTRIYVKGILELQKQIRPKAICHITGGGFYENIPRALPKGLGAKISKARIPAQPIFTYLQRIGNIPESDMYSTFNMGLGMCVIVSPKDLDAGIKILQQQGYEAFEAGEVDAKVAGIEIC